MDRFGVTHTDFYYAERNIAQYVTNRRYILHLHSVFYTLVARVCPYLRRSHQCSTT